MATEVWRVRRVINVVIIEDKETPFGETWKSLAACQITPCLQNLGTVSTFIWNSRLRERLENLVHLASCPLSEKLGNGEYLYMEFTLEREAQKFGVFVKMSIVCIP